MQNPQQYLYDRIAKLSPDKMGKVISFVRFIEQEPEDELWLDPAEDDELNALIESGDFVDAADLRAKIDALPDD